MLKRKQGSHNADWLQAVEHIEELVPREELEKAERGVIEAIRCVTAGKRVAFAWSGGKDSVVLAMLCQAAGLKDSLFVHCDLEYPAFLRWCLEHNPEGCSVINTHQDIEWLTQHPDMIFPRDSRLVYRWYRIVQQAGIRQYVRENNLDMMVVGHRKADGNYTGKDGISTNKEGVTRYAPIAEWPHEYILAAIHYHRLALPPIYGWKDGYRCGTHPWPARVGMLSTDQGFREVYEIDPDIVRRAATYLPGARHVLKGVGA